MENIREVSSVYLERISPLTKQKELFCSFHDAVIPWTELDEVVQDTLEVNAFPTCRLASGLPYHCSVIHRFPEARCARVRFNHEWVEEKAVPLVCKWAVLSRVYCVFPTFRGAANGFQAEPSGLFHNFGVLHASIALLTNQPVIFYKEFNLARERASTYFSDEINVKHTLELCERKAFFIRDFSIPGQETCGPVAFLANLFDWHIQIPRECHCHVKELCEYVDLARLSSPTKWPKRKSKAWDDIDWSLAAFLFKVTVVGVREDGYWQCISSEKNNHVLYFYGGKEEFFHFTCLLRKKNEI